MASCLAYVVQNTRISLFLCIIKCPRLQQNVHVKYANIKISYFVLAISEMQKFSLYNKKEIDKIKRKSYRDLDLFIIKSSKKKNG